MGGFWGPTSTFYSSVFRSGEKTFSLITQVVGRSGRFDKPGAAYIQTISPDHPVIQAAARQDYVSFTGTRSRCGKRPCSRPSVTSRSSASPSADEAEARRAAEGMHEILKKLLLSADPKLPAVLLGVSEAGIYG